MASHYKGCKQFPDAAQQQQQQVAPGRLQVHHKHHLQLPGVPFATASGSSGGGSRSSSDGGGSNGGSAAAAAAAGMVPGACVLLEDLDSWYASHCSVLAAKIGPAHSLACKMIYAMEAAFKSGAIPRTCWHGAAVGCDSTSSSSSDSGRQQRAVAVARDAEPLSAFTQLLVELVHSGQLQQLATAFQEAGVALCQLLPVPWCCNNPACQSMAGDSELQLVGGKGSICGGCKVAR
jgi:hypothetical protein